MRAVATTADTREALQQRGLRLEYATLGWNVVGIFVLAATAIAARSVALAGFGLDSAIEIFASLVVIGELGRTSTAATSPHVAANDNQTPGTARLPVWWIR